MDSPIHHYGPTCLLAPVTEPMPNTDNDVNGLLDGIPSIDAQFFYHSLIPIDDPLSTANISAAATSSKIPLRPFSRGDNNALERAWLTLADGDDRSNHNHALRNKNPSPSLAARNIQKLNDIVEDLVSEHREKHAREGYPQEALRAPPESLSSTQEPVCCAELLIDSSNRLRETFCAVTRKKQRSLDQGHVVCRVMARLQADQDRSTTSAPRLIPSTSTTASPRTESFVMAGLSTSARGRVSSLASRPADGNLGMDSPEQQAKTLPAGSPAQPEDPISDPAVITGSSVGASVLIRPPVIDDGLSGKPFLRVMVDDTDGNAPSEPASILERDTSAPPENKALIGEVARDGDQANLNKGSSIPERQRRTRHGQDVVEVPVGVSRLHVVTLPVLQMSPIYWPPLNDISIVSRSTWFYRDTMLGVEPVVANLLESGYRELRPWTQTWRDELRCAVDIGALGEEKVAWPLWGYKSKDHEELEPSIASDPFCAAHCFKGEAATEGTLEPVQSVKDAEKSTSAASTRNYAAYHVVYRDSREAFLLKPSLKPSAYYSRRPVGKITKGVTVGIPVVRGFDREAWDEIHEKKKRPTKTKESQKAASHHLSPEGQSRDSCPGCNAEKDRGQVTDLVLIAHGIGQKLAERVESFHFTHAVTAFRRSANIEYGSESVKSVLRKDQNGIMVLPVNWRSSFEDGGPTEEDRNAYSPEGFSLKDIEPNTIPAVRRIISDVMFDVPYYMSPQLKPKMIQALVGEANRVYRLWCRNNPGFAENGRVHLVAHSLGSVMSIEILSKNQPTIVPPLELKRPSAPETNFFEFNTANLFLLGSPVAFFLLLERGNLLPRRGRRKPGADLSDVSDDVVGEAGLFGCIAVDNVYNIVAREDPIAYLLNGTVDPAYASSLKTAYVPSATTSWYSSMGDAVRGIVPGVVASSDAPVKPPTLRLPSQLELEVHDFTREEAAERKAFLLNDNGQIDYYLRSGGGPLEIQYLNMLGAHSSYWTNPDFIRMLCMEIGRKPGRAHTLPVLRAVKATRRLAHATK